MKTNEEKQINGERKPASACRYHYFFPKKKNKRPYFYGCTVEKLGENNNKEGEMWWRTRERVDLPNTVEEVVIWLLSC